MTVMMSVATVAGLSEVVHVLREWQVDGAPMQLHPGDIGWHWRFGAQTVAAAVRIWSREDRILAVGLLDGAELLRVAVAPEARCDERLARRMLADVSEPERGVLPPGVVSVEARSGGRFAELLLADGWGPGEPWTPLCRDLTEPVEDAGVRVEVIGPERDSGWVAARAAVQRAAFDRSTFTQERWHAMAAGPAYAEARCLLGYGERGTAVAAATVWSAGPGRPGLLEPVGVHRAHRGHGYGTAISLAAASALREMGASSATVCTPSANVRAVATYRSAGFQELPEVRDLCRSR